MSSSAVPSKLIVLNQLVHATSWIENCDRSPLPMEMYPDNQVRVMTPHQMKQIIVPLAQIGPNGANIMCRQCEWLGTSKLQADGFYF